MTVDLSTRYLGLALKNPLVVAASPLTAELHSLGMLEVAGAAAAVLPSLFEEQIEHDQLCISLPRREGGMTEEAVYQPMLSDYNAGPDSYLRHIEAAKKASSIPIIGSLNGTSKGGWVRFAKLIQEAGADALELNIYFVPTDPSLTAQDVETRYLDVLSAVRATVSIPLAVKVGPYFSSLPNMARRFVEAGANGLVLFNRYLQPDIDIDTLEVTPSLLLSSHDELRLPLRWIAILRGQTDTSLAATSGVQAAEDVVKALLAGADVTMMASALIRHGAGHLRTMLEELERWLAAHNYHSINQIKAHVSQHRYSNPAVFERANYMKAITSLSND